MLDVNTFVDDLLYVFCLQSLLVDLLMCYLIKLILFEFNYSPIFKYISYNIFI